MTFDVTITNRKKYFKNIEKQEIYGRLCEFETLLKISQDCFNHFVSFLQHSWYFGNGYTCLNFERNLKFTQNGPKRGKK